jgi:hypothetical protein
MALLAGALAANSCVPSAWGEEPPPAQIAAAAPVAAKPAPEPPPTRTVGELLSSGVVITISLSSQRMHVFRDGVLWRSSPISTGRRGKATPAGVFAVLQKKPFHRSNLYSNAPMPFMQRLTWSGIAIHAGHLPGYPASHGCIRVPKPFAKELYAITNPAATAVIIHKGPLRKGEEALALARASDARVPIAPDLLRRERAMLARRSDEAAPRPPAARTIPAPAPLPVVAAPAGGQTIQLAATLSPALASAHWEEIAGRRPELKAMRMAIIPAVVNGTQYYRLRVSAPDAHATCKALKRDGIGCFPVG